MKYLMTSLFLISLISCGGGGSGSGSEEFNEIVVNPVSVSASPNIEDVVLDTENNQLSMNERIKSSLDENYLGFSFYANETDVAIFKLNVEGDSDLDLFIYDSTPGVDHTWASNLGLGESEIIVFKVEEFHEYKIDIQYWQGSKDFELLIFQPNKEFLDMNSDEYFLHLSEEFSESCTGYDGVSSETDGDSHSYLVVNFAQGYIREVSQDTTIQITNVTDSGFTIDFEYSESSELSFHTENSTNSFLFNDDLSGGTFSGTYFYENGYSESGTVHKNTCHGLESGFFTLLF